MLFYTHLVCLDYGTLLVVAAELVYASHQGFVVAFGHAHCLHAPRFAGMDAWVLLVAGYDPVGADHAVVASLLAQLSGYDFAVEAVAHFLVGLVV